MQSRNVTVVHFRLRPNLANFLLHDVQGLWGNTVLKTTYGWSCDCY